MALSLVGDYGGSGSSSSSEEEESGDEMKRTETKSTKSQISLPSAADLFDSVEAGAASFMSAPVPESDVPLTTPKRKPKARDGRSNSSDPKRAKGSSTGEGNNERANASHSGQPKGFIPPQMTRPNIVTEDSALWSSNASIKRQRQLEAGRRGSGGGGAAAAKKGKDGGEKGGKDSMSFKQREKAKRDNGQASRGKSYVEEEKRLLRELGSS